MAEVTNFIDDIFTQCNTKMKEMYDKKLLEHQNNISYNLSDGYEKDYGLIKTEFDTFITNMDKNRYAIHKIQFTNLTGNMHHTCRPCMLVFDNYGDYYCIGKDHCDRYGKPEYIQCGELHYILPNILIDMIKEFKTDNTVDMEPQMYRMMELDLIGYRKVYDKLLKNIKKIAEDYYNKFIIYKSLLEQNKKLNKIMLENNETIRKLQLYNDDKEKIIYLSRQKKNIEIQIEHIQYYIINNTEKNIIQLNKKHNKLRNKLENINNNLNKLNDVYDIYSSSDDIDYSSDDDKIDQEINIEIINNNKEKNE